MKKLVQIAFVIMLSLSLFSCTIINENEAGVDVAKLALPSVLELTCEFQASISSGTGFIIDDKGYVITNAHVVTESLDRFIYEALEIKGKFYNSTVTYLFDLIAYDVEKDLAILKFQRNDLVLKAVSIGNSEFLSFGATIFTLGNPEGNGICMTKGIISIPKVMFKDTKTGIVNEVIQIDAPVNSGSSGGPLLDIEGKVIGIISFKIKNTDKNIEGIGFAIPSRLFMQYFSTTISTLLQSLENAS